MGRGKAYRARKRGRERGKGELSAGRVGWTEVDHPTLLSQEARLQLSSEGWANKAICPVATEVVGRRKQMLPRLDAERREWSSPCRYSRGKPSRAPPNGCRRSLGVAATTGSRLQVVETSYVATCRPSTPLFPHHVPMEYWEGVEYTAIKVFARGYWFLCESRNQPHHGHNVTPPLHAQKSAAKLSRRRIDGIRGGRSSQGGLRSRIALTSTAFSSPLKSLTRHSTSMLGLTALMSSTVVAK